jgi:hypothetical protein
VSNDDDDDDDDDDSDHKEITTHVSINPHLTRKSETRN